MRMVCASPLNALGLPRGRPATAATGRLDHEDIAGLFRHGRPLHPVDAERPFRLQIPSGIMGGIMGGVVGHALHFRAADTIYCI